MRKISVLLILLLSAGLVKGQSSYTMRSDSLVSEVLKQTRKFEIFLPEGYDTIKSRLPVIYVLDGEGRDRHIVPTILFLNNNEKMPRAIVVGISNIDRNHDFLPDSTKGAPTGGGADKFLRFFGEELIPFIDRSYMTEQYRVLIGHSFGGLFATYALLKQPELFNAYIAMDPSFWYNDRKILKYAAEEFSRPKDWDRPIFITGREGEGLAEMGIPPMEELLKQSAPVSLRWKLAAYPFEDHGSVTFKSAYDGLRYIFDSGGSVKVIPQSGIIPEGASFQVYPQTVNPDLRYTTDGSEPVPGSPACSQKLILTGPCTLIIKDVAKKYRNYPALTVTYTKGDYPEGIMTMADLKPGLKYSLYAGVFDSLPLPKKMKPVKTGISGSIDPAMTEGRDSFALRFDGYLFVKEKALYDVWIMSDADAVVYINGNPVLKNTGPHPAQAPNASVLPLKAGYYPVSVACYGKKGCKTLMVGMLKDGDMPEPAPLKKEDLFHRDKK